MTNYLWPLDIWVKVAQIVTALLTPAIAVWIGILSSRIQHQQSTIQKQQANTSHLQFRLALMERRMKVFNATQEFIALVLREAKIETLEPLFTLLRETRESQFLFGSEISG
jgi:K+-sensing histidine kinase KdpD